MDHFNLEARLTRRRLLALGGTATGTALATGPSLAIARGIDSAHGQSAGVRGHLPIKRMEKILGAQASPMADGVWDFPVSRDDLHAVGDGVPFDGSFELDGDLFFQPLGDGRVFFNGDLPFKDSEMERAIDAMLRSGLTFQAQHQHFYFLKPIVWFMHFRAVGHPLRIAHGIKHVLDQTSTPFPQKQPSNPKTPLDVKRLEKILKGKAEVGTEGVVTVWVLRTDRIKIAGHHVSPQANISTNISFKPLNSSGSRVAAAPDFSMTSSEVMPVMRTMRPMGWDVGCLYNQETDEHPQLYFSHQLKKGDPYALAREIRKGLDLTAVTGSPGRGSHRSRSGAGGFAG